MSEKENNHKFLISIIVLILVAIAIYFIVLTYNEAIKYIKYFAGYFNKDLL